MGIKNSIEEMRRFFLHITVRNWNYTNLRDSNIFMANTAAVFVQSLAWFFRSVRLSVDAILLHNINV